MHIHANLFNLKQMDCYSVWVYFGFAFASSQTKVILKFIQMYWTLAKYRNNNACRKLSVVVYSAICSFNLSQTLISITITI